MSINHHGEICADRVYARAALASILGYKDPRKIDELEAQGLRGFQSGKMKLYAGSIFLRFVEEQSMGGE